MVYHVLFVLCLVCLFVVMFVSLLCSFFQHVFYSMVHQWRYSVSVKATSCRVELTTQQHAFAYRGATSAESRMVFGKSLTPAAHCRVGTWRVQAMTPNYIILIILYYTILHCIVYVYNYMCIYIYIYTHTHTGVRRNKRQL